MEFLLSINRIGDIYNFYSEVDSSEVGMGPYWTIHWGSGTTKMLRTPILVNSFIENNKDRILPNAQNNPGNLSLIT